MHQRTHSWKDFTSSSSCCRILAHSRLPFIAFSGGTWCQTPTRTERERWQQCTERHRAPRYNVITRPIIQQHRSQRCRTQWQRTEWHYNQRQRTRWYHTQQHDAQRHYSRQYRTRQYGAYTAAQRRPPLHRTCTANSPMAASHAHCSIASSSVLWRGIAHSGFAKVKLQIVSHSGVAHRSHSGILHWRRFPPVTAHTGDRWVVLKAAGWSVRLCGPPSPHHAVV
jgi:hypothetical protein